MQNLSLSNIFDEKRREFENSRLSARLYEKFRAKSFQERNQHLYSFTRVVSIVAQVISAVTASIFIFSSFQDTFSGLPLSVLLAGVTAFAFLFGVELLQRSQTAAFLQKGLMEGYSANQMPAVILIVSISALSVFCSWKGSFDMVQVVSTPPAYVAPQLHDIASLREQARRTIDARSKAAESFLTGSQYLGRTSMKDRAIYAEMIKQRDQLEKSLLNDIASKEKENARRLNESKSRHDEVVALHEANTSRQGIGLAGVTVACQVVFFLCLYFMELYDREVYREFIAVPSPVHQLHTAHVLSTADTLNPLLNKNRQIGFTMPEKRTAPAPVTIPDSITVAHIDGRTGESRQVNFVQIKRNLSANVSRLKRCKPDQAGQISEKVKYWESKADELRNKFSNSQNAA